MAIFIKENALRVADFLGGAILKKIAIFIKENALRVADFLKRNREIYIYIYIWINKYRYK